MLSIDNILPYIGLYDTNPCVKNGEIDYFHNKIELTINLTNSCNANCSFCCNAAYANLDYCFDFDFFKEVFETLKTNFFIAKVAITGGEPTLSSKYAELLAYIRQELPLVEIVVNSNGINLPALQVAGSYGAELGISRHHYIDSINEQIFQSKNLPTAIALKNFEYKSNILLHCNLIKGYIDSIDECVKYLDWAIDVGISQVGFVTLMPYTSAAKRDAVFVNLFELPDIIITRIAERKNICSCGNVRYKDKINVYMRCTCANIVTNKKIPNAPFVFNLNKLTHGFNGPIIWAKD